jgi:hypothetical protein
VGTQGGYWARAADGWSDHIWQPIVQRDIGFRYKYEGREPVGPGISDRSRLLFRAAATPLEAFHVKLHELSVMPIRVSWVFRPLTSFGVAIDRDRKAAQRVVFDGSVIKPLADAARNKMSQPSPDRRGGAEEARREGNALLSLIQLEAAIVKRHESKPAGLFTGEKFLPPLFRYVSADSFGQDLVPTLDLTYAETRMWPPDWLSGGSRLATNTAIDQGLSRFVTESQKTGESRSDVFPLIVKARDAVREFGHAENSLYEAARRRGPTAEIDRSVLAGYTRLQGAKHSISRSVR